ncbi:hypothetical protein GOP47_0016981 [Adiantum capillus-veneris]|uniref:Secreted protein n=1 Tax=Adiantum capillus-veneris TaxID=13818 RepID=A0A9D4ZDI0_ADICA|nr:hypothetical protein GOP47_0016981 [Adiantum capillus-veneris]
MHLPCLYLYCHLLCAPLVDVEPAFLLGGIASWAFIKGRSYNSNDEIHIIVKGGREVTCCTAVLNHKASRLVAKQESWECDSQQEGEVYFDEASRLAVWEEGSERKTCKCCDSDDARSGVNSRGRTRWRLGRRVR